LREKRNTSGFLPLLCLIAIASGCSSASSKPSGPAKVTAEPGPWGVSCLPSKGEENNPACVVTPDAGTADAGASRFACYGISTTDANAFCTLFGCTTDDECPHAWWCADVNVAPNVTTDTGTAQTLGTTRRVCLPRGQCDPCETDDDCASTLMAGGTQQHCTADAQGNKYCAAQCESTSECQLDAVCSPPIFTVCSPAAGMACAGDEDCPPANGTYQHCSGGKCTPECGSNADCATGQSCQAVGLCTPRAGACVGDGTFCAPCRSDDDCYTGYCFSAAYSTERFCSALASAGACDTQALDPAICPQPQSGQNWKGSMCVETQPGQIECYGVVTIGASTSEPQNAPGCWTANR
jgi:hypothetical protein